MQDSRTRVHTLPRLCESHTFGLDPSSYLLWVQAPSFDFDWTSIWFVLIVSRCRSVFIWSPPHEHDEPFAEHAAEVQTHARDKEDRVKAAQGSRRTCWRYLMQLNIVAFVSKEHSLALYVDGYYFINNVGSIVLLVLVPLVSWCNV